MYWRPQIMETTDTDNLYWAILAYNMKYKLLVWTLKIPSGIFISDVQNID
jgi:hypothetical protein